MKGDTIETKEYKYAIIIDGLAYLLTEEPDIYEITNGSWRVTVTRGNEFAAYIPPSSTYVLIPYEDWLEGCVPRAGKYGGAMKR